MKNYISQVMKKFPEAEYNVCKLEQGYERLKRENMTEEDFEQLFKLIRQANKILAK
jgi:ribonucleoside-diphosphate reductase alpha chain